MPDHSHETMRDISPEMAETLYFCCHHSVLDNLGEDRALYTHALAQEPEEPAPALAAIFRSAGIVRISLASAQAAKSVADEWLASGAFDPVRARDARDEAQELNGGLAAVTRRAIDRGILDSDLSNEPMVVTSVRSAELLMKMMLGWHADGKLQDPAWRQMMATKTALFATMLAETQADETNEPRAPRATPPASPQSSSPASPTRGSPHGHRFH